MWQNALTAGQKRHWLLDFLARFPKSRKKNAGGCPTAQTMKGKPLHGATAQQAWRAQMQTTYNLPEQNPARWPLYQRYKATRWNGEKQALARQAYVLTHKELARELGKPICLGVRA